MPLNKTLTFLLAVAALAVPSLWVPATANGLPPGRISGTVTDAVSGDPLSVAVTIFEANGSFHTSLGTDASGEYSALIFAPGTYYAVAGRDSAYLPELYQEIPCFPSCDPTTGTPIAVIIPLNAANIDFTLELGGLITGTVTEVGSGLPVGSAFVQIYDADGNSRGGTTVNASGKYSFVGLSSGTYFVTASEFGFRNELYDDLPCPGGSCDPTTGTPVVVDPGETVAGIDFALDRLGAISGTVIEAGTGVPIGTGSVWVYDEAGHFTRDGFLESDGSYRVNDLEPGTYFAVAITDNHLDELYDDAGPCPFGECEVTTGTPIAVTLNTTALDIDFELPLLGAISGTVTESAGGQPIPSLQVVAMDETGRLLGSGSTDASGLYTIGSLAEGSVYIQTSDFFVYQDELYDGIPCPKRSCDLLSGTPVAVTFATTTPGIDFDLERLGSITGVVTEEDSGEPIPHIEIRSLDAAGIFQSSTFTDEDGRYLLGGLAAGNHFVRTNSFTDYFDELYDDLPCPRGSCDPQSGAAIAVTLDTTTEGIDFALGPLGSISGVVTSSVTGEGVDAAVEIFDASGDSFGGNFTETDGRYTVTGLPAGSYFAVTGSIGHEDELYDDLPCPFGECDPATGSPIAVVAGDTTLGINFELVPLSETNCFPSPTTLCLNEDRFQVDIDWRDAIGQAGPGFGTELTDDTGTFWFFSPDNVELVIKVLDGCFDPFNTFWVFAGGLTDVAVDLRVTDTLTGEVRTYGNALGTAFEPIQDLAAFATCDASAVGGDDLRGLAPLEMEGLTAEPSSAVAPGAVAPGAVPPGAVAPGVAARRFAPSAAKTSSGCLADGEALCLAGGRFEVKTLWSTGRQSGQGQAVQLTGDTGIFWFFSPENVEAVVKVLDACNLDPFNNFWVFAAGLTDVEVTLQVTDTQTGETREWVNPLGAPYQPIRETGSFMTCP